MSTLLIIIIFLAVAFDFINGFHDAANSIAAIVSTRVLKPQWAVVWAAFFNFIAFLFFGVHVATTIGTGLVNPDVINTSINTGTVIGVSCNVFGSGLTPKYIPNFSWGSEGVDRYDFEKALLDIEGWKQLKGQTITKNEKSILKYIFDHF